MGSPRPTKDVLTQLRDLALRVKRLERPRLDSIAPVRLNAAATITATVPTGVSVAAVDPAGSTVSFLVVVTPTGGAVTSLRLRDEAGNVSDTVLADSTATSKVTVTLPTDASWDPAAPQLVYIDAWVSTGSASVLPVRAVCT